MHTVLQDTTLRAPARLSERAPAVCAPAHTAISATGLDRVLMGNATVHEAKWLSGRARLRPRAPAVVRGLCRQVAREDHRWAGPRLRPPGSRRPSPCGLLRRGLPAASGSEQARLARVHPRHPRAEAGGGEGAAARKGTEGAPEAPGRRAAWPAVGRLWTPVTVTVVGRARGLCARGARGGLIPKRWVRRGDGAGRVDKLPNWWDSPALSLALWHVQCEVVQYSGEEHGLPCWGHI